MAGISSGGKDDFSLNLYPMLDIFSILITFLLMSYSADGQTAESKVANLELPKSEVKMSLDDAATVSISKTEVIIQGGLTIPIGPDGDVPDQYRQQGAIQEAYKIFKTLHDSTQTLKNRDQNLKSIEKDLNSLTMEADKDTQFKLIKRVMLSAQQAEFVGWKLAVDKEIQ